ncbi:flagellar assembly protein FliX [Terasakiella sp. A23]|uniref:flagellar assembly protein FliX n=1 Tax=Terasakiella sp. FCG-A23 TaxID=3080561 RepID=UPI0029545850|nr:flagellar assembly protein FliX [Terasakiella sp. A23]MDV7339058.1 flagellar assembly protein FliX [Terasakiella sp. A23]
MKISNVGPTKQLSSSAKKSKAQGSGNFASHLGKSSGSEGHTEIMETPPVASMDSILALQEVGDSTEEEHRRALYQRGEDILDRLSEIQREILSGAISVERLQNLAHLLRSRRQTVDDPRLAQIIDEIELRAEVEIAKWGRSQK